VTADGEPAQLTDAAAGVGEHCEKRSVAEALRCCRIGCIEDTAAVFWRERDGLAVACHGRRIDEVTVGRIGAGEALTFQVRIQRAERRHLPPDRGVGETAGVEVVPPGGNVAGSDARESFGFGGGHAEEGEELVDVAGVVGPGIGRG
jgi:hypothetical protein